MKVKELIAFLKKQDQELDVAYGLYSEQCLLESSKIIVEVHCVARTDGWIENARTDKPTQKYLVFPGN